MLYNIYFCVDFNFFRDKYYVGLDGTDFKRSIFFAELRLCRFVYII